MVSPDSLFRDVIASRLREDLVGPLAEEEVLTDRPSQRYSTGILYPLDSKIEEDEDQELDLAVNEFEDSASDPDTTGVPLYAALKALCCRPLICCEIRKQRGYSDCGVSNSVRDLREF